MGDSTTCEACHSLKTMKSKSFEDTSKANKPEKSSPSTEKKYVVHVERISREKANGQTTHIGLHPSNLVITKMKMTADRKKLLEAKKSTREQGLEKGKIQQADVMQE